jgi:hypothetical protein
VLRNKRNILSVAGTGLKLQKKKVLQRGKGKGAVSYQYVKRSEDGRVGSERRGPGVDDDGVVGGGDDEVPEATQARNGFTCR